VLEKKMEYGNEHYKIYFIQVICGDHSTYGKYSIYTYVVLNLQMNLIVEHILCLTLGMLNWTTLALPLNIL
jgi:hypothetical protein